jgi:Transposase DDE domain
VIDANGNPLNFTLSKANRHDQVNVLETIDGIKIGKRRRRPKRLGLDKGYDSDTLRRELRRRRIVPIASYRSNRKIDPATLPAKERHGKRNCRQRWKSNAHSLGSIAFVVWIAFSKSVKNHIAHSSESFSSSTT